jgi:large subunit ribosomal protein L24
MKFWSKHWKSSKQPRKQRKYVYHAPLHVRHKFLSAHLSKELREKFNRRSFPLRKGDEVEVMRGKFKKRTGKVSRVDLKELKVYIDGITRKKVDGSEVQVPFHPSNLKIINLNLEDKKRLKALTRTVKKEEKHVKTSEKIPSAKVLESTKKRKNVGSKSKTRSS